METNADEAQAALDAVATAQARGAQIATSTPWYAPWYGLTAAAFPLGAGLFALHSSAALFVFCFGSASLALLLTTYRRVTGVWPASEGLALVGLYVMAGVIMLVAVLGSFFLAPTIGLGWLVGLYLITAVAMTLLSRRFDTAYARKYGAR